MGREQIRTSPQRHSKETWNLTSAQVSEMRILCFVQRAGVVLAMLLILTTCSNAHILIFKDGFTIHGRIKEPGNIIADPVTGEGVFLKQGIYILDSDARWISFSHHQVPPEGVVDKELIPENETIKLDRGLGRVGPPMYPIHQVFNTTDWAGDWSRTLKMRVDFGRGKSGALDVEQRLVVLTPQYAHVDGRKYNWSSFYSINELDRSTVRSLLFSYPEKKSKNLKEDTAWRWQVYHFFVQAGWYDLADGELAGIEKDLPDQKETVAKTRETLLKLRSIQLFDEIEKAQQAGRHRWAEEYLAKIPRAGVDDRLLASVRNLRAQYETTNEKLTRARNLLKELPHKAASERRPWLSEAVAMIMEDLNHESVSRLDAFLTQAQQTEREGKNAGNGEKAGTDPAELLALAVTGWLLGKDAAEAKVDSAERLWKARTFVLDYLRTENVSERERKLKEFQNTRTDPLGVDEAAQMLRYLPPTKPETEIGAEPLRRKTEVPGSARKAVDYVVQLPPEYRHGRAYPVLIVLHGGGGDNAADMVKRVSGLAARHGYIVAAPDWEAWGNTYEHTQEENERVVDVVVDLRRHFQVDSDRVFLFGAGEGGKMAFDVGLSHPDLFAGVMPMAAAPYKHAFRYWANAQYLPFYVVDGTFSGEAAKANQELFKKWVPLGFPGIYVQYKGRGVEWFPGEFPNLFDWMDRKKDQFKRATAFPELGRLGGSLNREFLSLRDSDNRFYWISSEGLLPNQSVDGRSWRNGVLGGTVYARIHENTIQINSRNFKRLTVWLTKEMIDFSKPVSVRINGEPRLNNLRVQASLKTLLEDVYQRGDRQRVFCARLEFDR